jgi:hypothetical protein
LAKHKAGIHGIFVDQISRDVDAPEIAVVVSKGSAPIVLCTQRRRKRVYPAQLDDDKLLEMHVVLFYETKHIGLQGVFLTTPEGEGGEEDREWVFEVQGQF